MICFHPVQLKELRVSVLPISPTSLPHCMKVDPEVAT